MYTTHKDKDEIGYRMYCITYIKFCTPGKQMIRLLHLEDPTGPT